MTPAAVQLIDAEGRTRDDARVSAHDEPSTITLPDGLPRGTQVVSYRVISADGIRSAGSLVFSIGMRDGNGSCRPSATIRLAILIWLARIGVYLGLFAGVGGVFFCGWIARGTRGLEGDHRAP